MALSAGDGHDSAVPLGHLLSPAALGFLPVPLVAAEQVPVGGRAVETLIPTVVGLGLAIAICSPISVVTVILLLSMPTGRRRAIAFIAGWLVAAGVIGVVTVWGLAGQDFSSRSTTPSRIASALEVVIGAVLSLWSIRWLRRRPRSRSTVQTPRWVQRLEHTHWSLAMAAGAFMLTYSLTVAAAIEILKADVSTAEAALAFALFALASIAGITAPVVLAFADPERSAERLAVWRRWLLGNTRTIGFVLLAAIGLTLIARGLYDLVAG